ncbi:MAG: DUF805 domain-containing protein [Rhodoluna sp.]
MDFVGAIQAGFRNYANFRGVATRAEYWYFVLFIFLSGLVLSTIDAFSSLGVLSLGFNIATLVPSLSVLVRRLRDAGYSWTWLLTSFASLGVFLAGVIGLVSIAVNSGLMNWVQFANPNQDLDPAVLEAIAQDASFGLFAILTFGGLLLTLGTSILVNIIFPAMPSKSAADGNKRIKPETL